MLYRATECSKRAASPPRNDSSYGTVGGQLGKTGAPVSGETMPDLTGAMLAQDSSQPRHHVYRHRLARATLLLAITARLTESVILRLTHMPEARCQGVTLWRPLATSCTTTVIMIKAGPGLDLR